MKRYAIGIDLGGTLIKIGLIRDDTVVAKRIVPADSGNGLARRLPIMEEQIREMLVQYNVEENEFAGIGFCFPGLADSKTGRVISTNAKYDDAVGLDIAKWAHGIYGGGFHIDNDARMATIGEWKFGAGKGCDNVVTMTIGTGIGCGVIIEGRLLQGVHHQAGCLGGHMIVDYRGRRCSCGNIGCAEACASSFFLNDIVRACDKTSPDFFQKYGPFDFQKIFTLAADNIDARIIRNECMDVWAAAIVNLIHAYDPEIVILSGGIMRSAGVILPYMSERVSQLAWTPWGTVRIEASALMDDAAILGAAYCVNKNLN